MRLPIRSRPLLSFIRGTTFSSSGVILKQPSTSQASATARSARSLPKRPRLRKAKHGVIRRRHAVNPRIIAAEDTATDIPASPDALVITTPAKAIKSTKVKATDKDDTELKRRVWGLALPSIGEQLLSLGVGVSDTFLSGHLSDHAIQALGYGRATAVAAVGIASTAAWIVLTVFFGVNIGVTALVARATGARDGRLASRTVGQGIWLGAIIGLVMIGLAIPLAHGIIALLGVSGIEADLAASYIRVYSLTMPAAGAASAMNAAMRGSGDARRPLMVMLIVNGANIAASWTLMNGVPALGIPPIGVVGSAVGAATGWTLGCVLAAYLMTRQHPRAPLLTRAALRPNFGIMGRVLRVGIPSAAELVVFQLGVLTFNRVVIGLGPVTYAANVTINTVDSIGTLPGFGFSVAATALVGQALGARDTDLAERSVWASLRPAVLVMVVVGVFEAVIPRMLLGVFVADPPVLNAGDIAMRLSLLLMPASACSFVFNGALRGAGDTRFPVLVRAAGTWGLRLPVAALMIPIWGLPGARLAMGLDFWTQAGLSYWRFRSGRWRSTRV
ncbi:MAG TPA: MATE family efflux transporter [Ktedonobacterales bacterium]|nr:MATE family efflux transporter [Ktedonobacterales bacterium]